MHSFTGDWLPLFFRHLDLPAVRSLTISSPVDTPAAYANLPTFPTLEVLSVTNRNFLPSISSISNPQIKVLIVHAAGAESVSVKRYYQLETLAVVKSRWVTPTSLGIVRGFGQWFELRYYDTTPDLREEIRLWMDGRPVRLFGEDMEEVFSDGEEGYGEYEEYEDYGGYEEEYEEEEYNSDDLEGIESDVGEWWSLGRRTRESV